MSRCDRVKPLSSLSRLQRRVPAVQAQYLSESACTRFVTCRLFTVV